MVPDTLWSWTRVLGAMTLAGQVGAARPPPNQDLMEDVQVRPFASKYQRMDNERAVVTIVRGLVGQSGRTLSLCNEFVC